MILRLGAARHMDKELIHQLGAHVVLATWWALKYTAYGFELKLTCHLQTAGSVFICVNALHCSKSVISSCHENSPGIWQRKVPNTP